MVGFRSCVNYEVKWRLGFESGIYIRVRVYVMIILRLELKVVIILRLGLR